MTNLLTDLLRASAPARGGALDLGHDNARIAIRIIRLLASDGQPVARDRALDKVAELASPWASMSP